MTKILIIVIITSGLLSCSSRASNKKTLDFGAFTIVTPVQWQKIDTRGTDSYVGKIAIDSIDTLEFDLGLYSNDLTEYYEFQNHNGETWYFSTTDTTERPTMVDSSNKHLVVKSNISWDQVDGRKVKILFPVNAGIGTTGIYIDSLWNSGKKVEHFNLYGTNLLPQNEKAVLEAFKTLKFHNKR